MICYKRGKGIALVLLLFVGLFAPVGCKVDLDREENGISVIEEPFEGLPTDDGFVPDINLTALNSVMLSGIMNHITNNHEEYIGKTTQVRGMYFNFFSEVAGEYVHVILIEDQVGCCQYGFQFQVSEGSPYSTDFLEDGDMIEFRGVFQSCNQWEQPIIYLLTERIYLVPSQ